MTDRPAGSVRKLSVNCCGKFKDLPAVQLLEQLSNHVSKGIEILYNMAHPSHEKSNCGYTTI